VIDPDADAIDETLRRAGTSQFTSSGDSVKFLCQMKWW
jgi:hypothetical protein